MDTNIVIGDYSWTPYAPYTHPVQVQYIPQYIPYCIHCTNTDVVNQLLLDRIRDLEKRLESLENLKGKE